MSEKEHGGERGSGVTHLYLIRHGEAEANVNHVVGGPRGDTGLTARGVREVELLRDRLLKSREITAEVFLASTFPRARQTAEILAPAFGAPLSFDEDLQELRPGEADGLTLMEAMTRYGMPDFEADPGRAVSPGGESWAGLMERAGRALSRITADHEGKRIVLVTHGGFIDGAFLHFLGLPKGFPPVGFATRHASITHWRRQARWDGRVRWALLGFNDVEHVRGESR